MSSSLWKIDGAILSYYYVSQQTEYGLYYSLREPADGLPEGFYASERDQEIADYNQQIHMSQTSGDAAKAARGKMVYDDTTLPSERIKTGAHEADGQIISSGNIARESRKKKKKKKDHEDK